MPRKESGRRIALAAAAFAIAASMLAGCSGGGESGGSRGGGGGGTGGGGGDGSGAPAATNAATAAAEETEGPGDTSGKPSVPAGTGHYEADEQPSTVYYEIFVRSFYDSDGDGIGDLNGVTAKLDYLQELGIGGIWLMPINASPSYHGYDVTDYYAVNPEYGTLDDLKRLTDEAHKRGIKVIMDLVVNHTSSEHPWFKEAAADPDSPYRSWYRFAGADEKVKADGAAGGPPWHPLGSGRYLGIFWEGMPDLNFDEPAVREEMIAAGRYWLAQGLYGFRLDAAKHIYGDFASDLATEEVKAANQAWWQQFREGMIAVKPDVYLVGEVWDSAAVIAPFLDKGFDSAFNFDLAARLISSANGERDADPAFSLGRIYEAFAAQSGGSFIDAPFLSNHDQTRVMTALGGNADRAKTAAAMLLTLPGNPFLYYGEEIGMLGAKPDEYIREPMPWHAGGAGEGQTAWEKPRYNTGDNSVEAQAADGDSLLNRYKLLIRWRNEEPALRDGGIAPYALKPANGSVSAYIRMTKKERVLVVHNLSGKELAVDIHPEEPYGDFASLAHATAAEARLAGGSLTLPAYGTAILK